MRHLKSILSIGLFLIAIDPNLQAQIANFNNPPQTVNEKYELIYKCDDTLLYAIPSSVKYSEKHKGIIVWSRIYEKTKAKKECCQSCVVFTKDASEFALISIMTIKFGRTTTITDHHTIDSVYMKWEPVVPGTYTEEVGDYAIRIYKKQNNARGLR